MKIKTIDKLHINIYNEIINGKLNPILPENSNLDILRDLICNAHTKRVALLANTENPAEYIENTDFLKYGYKNRKDFLVYSKLTSKQQYEIIIKPMKVYNLLEVIDIPQFISFKCNCYMELLGDEFERIKIRAEHMLETADDELAIRSYANIHIQKAKKLLYDAKRALRNVQDTDNQEDIYIFFALNMFLVKTIIFYQKMFKPFISSYIDNEDKLFSEVIREISLRKMCSLFNFKNSGYGKYIKKSYIEKTDTSECLVNESLVIKGNKLNTKKSQTESIALPVHKRIKVNGQINVLVDMFVQLLEDISVPDGMFIETSRETLQDFFVNNFNDKNDKPLSPHTIRTLLKPYRVDKHIKKESPRRIDVQKILKRK